MTYEGLVLLNYELKKKLGEGGFGVVYLAEHTKLPRKVAVKILHPHYSRNKGLVDRFFQEAKAACAIGHESIIDVQNFGVLDTGEPYFLMEFFPGQALSDRITDNGPIPIAKLAEIFDPVVDALEAAHASDVIHRDLKPENIMVREKAGHFEKVKLLDFGIAKLVDPSAGVQSMTGLVMGTPMFMAPEQSRDSKNVDARADVYSLGATVFNALAGRPPFVAENMTDLIVEIQTQPAPALSTCVANVSPALDRAIAACLEKTPGRRPNTVRIAWQQIKAGLSKPTADKRALAATMPSGENPVGLPPTLLDDSARVPQIEKQSVVRAHQPATLTAGKQTTLSAGASEMSIANGPRSSRRWVFGLSSVVVVAGIGTALAIGLRDDTGAGTDLSTSSQSETSEQVGVAASSPPGSATPMSLADAAVSEPDATAVVSAEPEPDPTPGKQSAPDLDCRKSSFKPGKRASAVRRQLSRLKSCRKTKSVSSSFASRTRKALEKELKKLTTVASKSSAEPKKVEPKKVEPKKVEPKKVEPKKVEPKVNKASDAVKKPSCSQASFAVVYRKPKPSESEVRRALSRLKGCRPHFTPRLYKQIQTALIAKLGT